MNSLKGKNVHGWLSEANIPFHNFPLLRTSCTCPILVLMWISSSSQNDVASDAFTRVVLLTHTHVGKTLGKQFKHWWCYFWMRKWRVQKNGHSWVLPMAPPIYCLDSQESQGKHTLNLYVCGTALWDTLGFFPGAVAGVSLWTQCALNEAGLVSSFPSQRVENMIAPHIWYMIDMQCLSSQNQRPRSNSFFVQSWSSALKFRKCWIWGMKNWIASGKTMCWTGLLFTSTLEPRWKMPDFSWSGPTFWLKPRRFSRSNRGLEVGRLDG